MYQEVTIGTDSISRRILPCLEPRAIEKVVGLVVGNPAITEFKIAAGHFLSNPSQTLAPQLASQI